MKSIDMGKTRKRGADRPLAVVAMASLCACQSFAGSIVDLGDLGGNNTFATAISSNGNVVGVSLTSGGQNHTFIYSGGNMTDPGFNSFTHAWAINNFGYVTGSIESQTDIKRAFEYGGGSFTTLPVSSTRFASGQAINDRGEIAGYSDDNGFLYSGGQFLTLPTLGGIVYPFAINNNGDVVGYATTTQGSNRGFVSRNLSFRDLGTLGGDGTRPTAINDSRQVAGYSGTAAGPNHAFLYSLDGTQGMQDLGTLGGSSSAAFGINSSGQVVGQSETATGVALFLYTGGVMADLNTYLPANSGWQLNDAIGITDAGIVIGNGTFNGNNRVFLLDTTGGPTPAEAPEPGSIALVSAAVAMLAARGRQRLVSARGCRSVSGQ